MAKHHYSHLAGVRLLYSVVAGIITWAIFTAVEFSQISLLLGWCVTAFIFIGWTWLIIWPMDHERTAHHAKREDPSRVSANVLLTLASLASLGAVGNALFEAHTAAFQNNFLFFTITSIVSVALSWFLIQTIFTLRYARLYYQAGKLRSVVFAEDHQPTYSDFAYLAFTIGMTFQVSDNTLTGTAFRKTTLRQALLSYLFGTVILAITVSLISGLGH